MTFRDKLKLENGSTATRATDLLFVELTAGQTFKTREVAAGLKGLKTFAPSEPKARDDGRPPGGGDTVNQSERHRFVQPSGRAKANAARVRQTLGKQGARVSAVYYTDKEDLRTYFSPLADVLVVQPAETADPKAVRKLLTRHGLEVDENRSRYLTGRLYVTLKEGDATSYDLRGQLLRSRSIRTVHFEKVPLLSPTCALPSDPLYPKQWNLSQIEWHLDYLGCSQTTVIAVIDEGCDLAHPDLSFASPGLKLCTMQPDGSPTGSHGTPCAGIASAVTGNAEGVAGVAGRAKILPLAVCLWSDVEIANGINYATQFGADVISMSFGVYDWWNYWSYDLIDAEIVFATNHSTFLVAASGNENSASNNRYPAKHPLVLCVGGSNRDDVRKAAPDNSIEPWWGACYGLEYYEGSLVGVDVVAPCLEIPATDRLGSAGYTPGDYTERFNGTSSATPQVAGLAALIKSVFPNAGNGVVKEIIEKSADKIGGYTYTFRPEFPNSSWTQEVGHGRINVRRALDLVQQYLCCESGCCCDGAGSEPIAFSVRGTGHVSKGNDSQVKNFQHTLLNAGGGWGNDEFTAPESGIYGFDFGFVKDSYYKKGTQDDVRVYLQVNGAGSYGVAWSGQGSGRRGTGAGSVILRLDKGDKVRAMVHSDLGPPRHLLSFHLNGHKLAA